MNIGPATAGVEKSLAKMIPIAIDLLSRLLGISSYTDAIKELNKKIKECT